MAVMERLERIMERQQALGLAESAAETSQSWSVICNIFDQIVDIAGEERMSNEDLFELMSAGFEEVEIGLVPVTGDSVAFSNACVKKLPDESFQQAGQTVTWTLLCGCIEG